MDVSSLFLELYGRIPPLVQGAAEGADLKQLTTRPSKDANTIAWLIWHAGRVQDHHISEMLGIDQIWVGGNWASRFNLEPDPSNTGYAHSSKEVDSVRPEEPEALIEYFDAVDTRTRAMLKGLVPDDLDRVVDKRWNPPVTLGVRLVSVADDCLQHAGQAAYVRGLLDI